MLISYREPEADRGVNPAPIPTLEDLEALTRATRDLAWYGHREPNPDRPTPTVWELARLVRQGEQAATDPQCGDALLIEELLFAVGKLLIERQALRILATRAVAHRACTQCLDVVHRARTELLDFADLKKL